MWKTSDSWRDGEQAASPHPTVVHELLRLEIRRNYSSSCSHLYMYYCSEGQEYAILHP